MDIADEPEQARYILRGGIIMNKPAVIHEPSPDYHIAWDGDTH